MSGGLGARQAAMADIGRDPGCMAAGARLRAMRAGGLPPPDAGRLCA